MGFIGDTQLMKNSGLHKIRLNTEREANNLVEDLMKFVGWNEEKVKVFYEMKDNKRRMAVFSREWGDPEIRVLAVRAREVGTIIHELAHYKFLGHQRDYKTVQDMLIQAYMVMKDSGMKTLDKKNEIK